MSELVANKQVLRSVSAAFAAFVAAACLGGCPFVNQSHCAYMLDQGMESPCSGDQVCSKCTPENNGCVAAGDVEEACVLVLSGTTTMDTSTSDPTGSTAPTTSTTMTTVVDTTGTTMMVSTETATETDSDTTMTSVGPTTMDTTTAALECHPDESILDDFCDDASKPYCVGPDTCGPCGQLADIMSSCAAVEPDKPVCHGASGRCVQCTTEDTSACPVDKPGCDEETASCSKCTEHSQCPNTACDMKIGTCFPDDSIVWVENTPGKCSNNGPGSQAMPFCSLLAASNAVFPGQPTTIKITPGQNNAMQPLALPSEGYILAVVRGNPTIPTLDGSDNSEPMIQVSPGSRVYLSNLRLYNTNGSAIVECAGGGTGAELYADDVQIAGNGVLTAKGIDATNCDVKLRRTRVYKNRGGVQLSGGTLWAENSHFTENGSLTSTFGAFNFLGDATATITYSSIARQPVTGSTSTFNCSNPATVVEIRNSAVVGPKPFSKCTLDKVSSVVIEAETALAATTEANNMFSGPTEGVLRANKAGNPPPLKDVAIWTMGDPRYDFDREARPTVGPSWAGADEPQ